MALNRERSLCSPSQLQRRYLCPGSLELEKNMVTPKVKVEKKAAERGTYLHEVTIAILEKRGEIEDFPFKDEGDKTAVKWCVEKTELLLFQNPEAVVQYEVQTNLDELGIPAGERGNRIDVLMVIPGAGIVLVDFKFGQMWVEHPKYNYQFKAYGYGVWKSYGGKWINCVKLQPELDEEYRYMEYTFDADEMPGIGEDIKSIVETANSPDAPIVRDEKRQCMFCPCKDTCPAYRGAVLEIPQHIAVAQHLYNIEPAQRKDLYENIKALFKWCEQSLKVIEAKFYNESLQIDGYELGPGRKSKDWINPDEAVKKLKELAMTMKKNPEDVIIPPKLISPSAASKMFGNSKAVKQFLGKIISVSEGPQKIKKVKPEKKE